MASVPQFAPNGTFGPQYGPLESDDRRPLPIRRGRPIELLLVEDNPGDVRLTQEALKEGRVRVNLNTVDDGAKAIAFLRRFAPYEGAPRPDLILLDLNLPKMNGREVLHFVKTDPELRSIPVIVMTTSSADQDVHKAYNLNANCYINKPVELDHFLNVIRSIESFWLEVVTLPRD